jgi:hypothetical protein
MKYLVAVIWLFASVPAFADPESKPKALDFTFSEFEEVIDCGCYDCIFCPDIPGCRAMSHSEMVNSLLKRLLQRQTDIIPEILNSADELW